MASTNTSREGDEAMTKAAEITDLWRIDKSDGSEEQINAYEANATITRIAGHRGLPIVAVLKALRETNRIETDFAIYELRTSPTREARA